MGPATMFQINSALQQISPLKQSHPADRILPDNRLGDGTLRSDRPSFDSEAKCHAALCLTYWSLKRSARVHPSSFFN